MDKKVMQNEPRRALMMADVVAGKSELAKRRRRREVINSALLSIASAARL